MEEKSAPTITLMLRGTMENVKGDVPRDSPSTSRLKGGLDEIAILLPW